MGLSLVGFYASVAYTDRLQREHWKEKRAIMRQREAAAEEKR